MLVVPEEVWMDASLKDRGPEDLEDVPTSREGPLQAGETWNPLLEGPSHAGEGWKPLPGRGERREPTSHRQERSEPLLGLVLS